MSTLQPPDGRKEPICAIGDDFDPACVHAFGRQKGGKIDRQCVRCGWIPLARAEEGRVFLDVHGGSIGARTALALRRDLEIALLALGVTLPDIP